MAHETVTKPAYNMQYTMAQTLKQIEIQINIIHNITHVDVLLAISLEQKCKIPHRWRAFLGVTSKL